MIMKPENPFMGKPIRCFYDKLEKRWLFSAVDICAVLTGREYKAARLYWKRLKRDRTLSENQPVRKSYQLKMTGADGKYYFTEVLNIREVIYLIQTIPNREAKPFRVWLADVVADNTNIESLLAEAGAEQALEIEAYKENSNEPYTLLEVTVEKIYPGS